MLAASIFVPALYVVWLSFQQSTFGQDADLRRPRQLRQGARRPLFLAGAASTRSIVVARRRACRAAARRSAWRCCSPAACRCGALLLAVVLAPYAVSEVSARGDVALPVRSRCRADDASCCARSACRRSNGRSNPCARARASSRCSRSGCTCRSPSSSSTRRGSRIPGELYEAARDRRRQRAGSRSAAITLPLLMPAILVAMLFRYIFAFRLFSEVWLMTQGGPARIDRSASRSISISKPSATTRFGVAAATGWLMVLASLLLALRLSAPALPGDVRACRCVAARSCVARLGKAIGARR